MMLQLSLYLAVGNGCVAEGFVLGFKVAFGQGHGGLSFEFWAHRLGKDISGGWDCDCQANGKVRHREHAGATLDSMRGLRATQLLHLTFLLIPRPRPLPTERKPPSYDCQKPQRCSRPNESVPALSQLFRSTIPFPAPHRLSIIKL